MVKKNFLSLNYYSLIFSTSEKKIMLFNKLNLQKKKLKIKNFWNSIYWYSHQISVNKKITRKILLRTTVRWKLLVLLKLFTNTSAWICTNNNFLNENLELKLKYEKIIWDNENLTSFTMDRDLQQFFFTIENYLLKFSINNSVIKVNNFNKLKKNWNIKLSTFSTKLKLFFVKFFNFSFKDYSFIYILTKIYYLKYSKFDFLSSYYEKNPSIVNSWQFFKDLNMFIFFHNNCSKNQILNTLHILKNNFSNLNMWLFLNGQLFTLKFFGLNFYQNQLLKNNFMCIKNCSYINYSLLNFFLNFEGVKEEKLNRMKGLNYIDLLINNKKYLITFFFKVLSLKIIFLKKLFLRKQKVIKILCQQLHN